MILAQGRVLKVGMSGDPPVGCTASGNESRCTNDSYASRAIGVRLRRRRIAAPMAPKPSSIIKKIKFRDFGGFFGVICKLKLRRHEAVQARRAASAVGDRRWERADESARPDKQVKSYIERGSAKFGASSAVQPTCRK